MRVQGALCTLDSGGVLGLSPLSRQERGRQGTGPRVRWSTWAAHAPRSPGSGGRGSPRGTMHFGRSTGSVPDPSCLVPHGRSRLRPRCMVPCCDEADRLASDSSARSGQVADATRMTGHRANRQAPRSVEDQGRVGARRQGPDWRTMGPMVFASIVAFSCSARAPVVESSVSRSQVRSVGAARVVPRADGSVPRLFRRQPLVCRSVAS